MKIRISGSRDQLERIAALLPNPPKLYADRSGAGYRLYLDLDDRHVQAWLDRNQNKPGLFKLED